VALFVAPLLVVLSFVVGPQPLSLEFNPFELGGILIAVIIASHITNQGESTWFEGLMLLAVYAVMVAAFAFA
jgi:Ca2+:H+ antiporter